MTKISSMARNVGRAGAAVLLGLSVCVAIGLPANADAPVPPVATDFIADKCVGETTDDPTDNEYGPKLNLQDSSVESQNLLYVFGERLDSYNAGNIVPLYDSYGGSIRLDQDGNFREGQYSAYPALCGTRYVESMGGPVSEWMFCTDRHSPSCGDVDPEGNLIGPEGEVLNPMTGLDRNPRLSPEQEKVIAYLVQHGHSVTGMGHVSSDGTTDDRIALQDLVWCVSDPATEPGAFMTICEENMDAEEQARILTLIPDDPELVLDFDDTGATLEVGETARFTLTTNVYNQPITLITGGTADAEFSVCEGDATFSGSTLNVDGDDPTVSQTVVLCATASAEGVAEVEVAATPPSTQHIGWSQSQNNDALEIDCQVYATFHEVQRAEVRADAEATFAAAPDAPETDGDETDTDGSDADDDGSTSGLSDSAGADLPDTGAPVGLWALVFMIGSIGLGAALTMTGMRRRI